MRRRGWMEAGRRLYLKARFGVEQVRGRIRARREARARMLPLDRVHRRLELLLAAVYGRPIPIAPLEHKWTGPNGREFARRVFRMGAPIASVDGDAIYLPPELAEQDDVAALTRYRLIALEQAERMIRGTTEQTLPTDELERDLYLLREGAAIDAHIAQHHRGVAELLHTERGKALARRPKLDGMTVAERDVEGRLRDMLSARPEDLESPSPNPAASLEWARDTARSIRSMGAKYRGLPLTPIWGTVKQRAVKPIVSDDAANQKDSSTARPRAGSPESLVSAARSGESPEESKKQSSGSGKDSAPADDSRGKKDAKESKSESPRDPKDAGAADNRADGGSPSDARSTMIGSQLDHLPPPIYYDEWDSTRCVYLHRKTAVRLYECGDADETWIRGTLQEHAATSRRIRHQFERLRARRALLRRQRAGDELDIAACVNAIVDRRAGQSGDERLYIDARPARRGLAIALLVDVSGSTGVRVTESMRIIDLERIALLLAGEALDALGDLYAVYSFCGREASNIKLSVIKDFAERNGDVVHRRIAAMEPEGFTRLGAAVRHATTQLARQSAGHRLLLILSDGRPNDVDSYQGPYGVEDSRQAVLEARASGVYPFCLTIDAEASEYLPRIFGAAGHTILQRPDHLPRALLGVVRGLIGRA